LLAVLLLLLLLEAAEEEVEVELLPLRPLKVAPLRGVIPLLLDEETEDTLLDSPPSPSPSTSPSPSLLSLSKCCNCAACAAATRKGDFMVIYEDVMPCCCCSSSSSLYKATLRYLARSQYFISYSIKPSCCCVEQKV
jgi:hypothetical protein